VGRFRDTRFHATWQGLDKRAVRALPAQGNPPTSRHTMMSIATSPVRTWLRRAAVVAPVTVAAAAVDWALKAGAVAGGLHVVYHEREMPWKLIVLVLVLDFVWIIAYAGSPLLRIGIGLWFGGVLGNIGELAAHGHVTNFIPFPARYVASPADICLIVGYAIFALGLWRGITERRRRKRVALAS
jgi:Signal peptidase (SPase) II